MTKKNKKSKQYFGKNTDNKGNGNNFVLNKGNLTVVSFVIQIISSVLAILFGIVPLFTPIPFVAKMCILFLFYGTIFYLWTRSNDATVKKLLKIVGSVFTCLIFIWIAYTVYTMYEEKLNDHRRTPFFSESDSSFKILILPFNTHQHEGGKDIGDILYHRYKDYTHKENLNTRVEYWDDFSTRNIEDSVNYWKEFHHANLLIYGEFFSAEKEMKDGDIGIKYIADENNFLGKMNKNLEGEYNPVTLVGLRGGKWQGNIDFIIQSITGLKEYTQKNYSAAITRFLKIKDTFNPDKVFNMLGQSYIFLNNYDTSLIYFQKAINKNPQNVNAHVNLGALYCVMHNYKQSIIECELAIKNDSSSSHAYGMCHRRDILPSSAGLKVTTLNKLPLIWFLSN